MLIVFKFVFLICLFVCLFLMQNMMRTCNRAGCRGGKGISQPAPRRHWKENAPSRHPDSLHGARTLPSTQEGPPALTVPLIVLLPVLGKALREVASKEGGLSRALLTTGFSGFSCNPHPRLPPSPVSDNAFVFFLGYHHEKKGFRL